MDLKEILREAGIEDKVIKSILTSMKAEKLYITNEENADIRIKKYKEKQESLETELDEANKKIEDFKTLEEDKEKLTKEIETMKKEASEKEFNSALDSALKEFNSKNDKLVKALLDREKITLKDGKLEGIKEQLEEIKKENDFLFEKPVNPIPDFQTGSKHKSDPKPKSIGEKLAEARSQVTEIKY